VTAQLEITILGCGSSGGVPRADGAWGACDPADPRNRRGRCSLLVRRLEGEGASTTLVVDAAPEFRQQTAAAGVTRLDALLLTHDHADQTHGIDDIRAFAMIQARRIDCWMDLATELTMRRRFGYIFEGEGLYPAIGDIHAAPPFALPSAVNGPSGDIPVVTFDQDHGPGVRSLGYRFGDAAYSSDVVDLPESSFEALEGLDLWIVDALRHRPHPTHAHLEKTLSWVERLKPRRAILTNMHIDLDYKALLAELPVGVEPAYDGMRITLDFPGAAT
jgi:phosphoribosyl 1,2-cyclic phosphate phosphodiesterase